ncbi:hypothetical protein [Streptomyces sp. 142MFCol3.1]|uniref:hypothetical protein n=1 Tax=Streptomyces sp. 142MFCol3.1 TaxID=1172179 RepID=UPI000418F432|nr:hypothetical protein [Streptomyces sp. 142MFCol3.1]
MNTLLITADRVIAGPADRVTADGAVLVDESTAPYPPSAPPPSWTRRTLKRAFAALRRQAPACTHCQPGSDLGYLGG